MGSIARFQPEDVTMKRRQNRALAPITPIIQRAPITVRPERAAPENTSWLADLAYARLAYSAKDYAESAATLRDLERAVLGYTPPAGERTKAREKVLREIKRMASTLEAVA